jgi:hypothetical protein
MRRRARGPANYQWKHHQPGERFGCLILVQYVGTSEYGQLWTVRCECGADVGQRCIPALTFQAKKSKDGGPRCRPCAARMHWDARMQRGHAGSTKAGIRSQIAQVGAAVAFANIDARRHPEPWHEIPADLERALRRGETIT